MINIDLQQLADAMASAEITLFSQSTVKGFKSLVYYPLQPDRKLMVGWEQKNGDWEQKDFKDDANSLMDAIKAYNSIHL